MADTQRWDAIIIGSGLGGLSTAAHLAACGHRPLVLEQYSVLGGSSHVFRRKGEWEFDVGVHYIGDCGPNGQVPTLMRGLGLDDRIEWLPMNERAVDSIVGPDFQLDVPVGWDPYLENLIAAFPGEERGLRRYVSILRRIAGSIDRSLTPASAAGQARSVVGSGRSAPWMMMPVAALQVACGLSPKASLVLSLQLGAMATTPLAAPVALLAGYLHDFVGNNGWFPRGGGQVLSAGFAEVIRSHGGALRTHASVEKILIEGGRATGVRLDSGEEFRAPVVVSAIDLHHTYRKLVGYEHLPRTLRRRDQRWRMAWPLINGFFGIEIDLTEAPNSNYYAIPTWDSATSRTAPLKMLNRLLTKASGRDPMTWAADYAATIPGFVHSSTRRDPQNTRSAPPGHSAIEVQTLAPPSPELWGFDEADVASGAYRKNAQYRAIKEVVTEGLLARVEQVYPGASSKVRWAELATPATQERYTNTTGGNSYGLEPRVSQFGPFRPGSRTPVEGLFLAGTGTAWGPGTEGSMLSGLHAASAIVGRDLQREIRDGRVLVDQSRLEPWPDDFDPLSVCRRLRDGDKQPDGDDDPDPLSTHDQDGPTPKYTASAASPTARL